MASNWSWEKFLKFLMPRLSKSSMSPQASSTIEVYAEDSPHSLVQKVMKLIKKQDIEAQEKREKEMTDTKVLIIRKLREGSLHKECSSDEDMTLFKTFENMFKDYHQMPQRMKSDLMKSGSTWTVGMLKEYVQYEDVCFVCKPKFKPKPMDDEIITEVIKKVNMTPVFLNTECDTRVILNEILLPLCVNRGLRVQTEVSYKSDGLPSNRYDYIIYHNLQPIGCVEAKRFGSLESKSVVQLILQLLFLSTYNSKLFYFGILSDVHNIIFVGVWEHKVLFFQKDECSLEVEQTFFDKYLENNYFKKTIQTIFSFLDLAIAERENPTDLNTYIVVNELDNLEFEKFRGPLQNFGGPAN